MLHCIQWRCGLQTAIPELFLVVGLQTLAKSISLHGPLFYSSKPHRRLSFKLLILLGDLGTFLFIA